MSSTREVKDEILTLEDGKTEGCLRMRKTFQDLLTKNHFVDVTLSCLDGQLQAHRLILCAFSPYLYDLFTNNPTTSPCTHPMVILRDCKISEVSKALEFIYLGRTTSPRSELYQILNAAKELGCISLESVVHSWISPPKSPPATSSSSSSQLLSQINSMMKRSRSPSPKRSPVSVSVSRMPKLLRMTPGDSAPNSPPVLTSIDEFKDQIIQLRHDKAESFEYTNENLEFHLDEEESEDEGKNEVSKPASCPWCNQIFNSVTALQSHIKVHVGNGGTGKQFTCPYCNHEFARSAHLKRHVRTHTGEKPYKCTFCDREFSRQDKMKAHMTRHAGGSFSNTVSGSSQIRTSYPPQNSSINSGQVPIKILLPTHTVVKSDTSPPSPSSFFTDDHSVSINAIPSRNQGRKISDIHPQTHSQPTKSKLNYVN